MLVNQTFISLGGFSSKFGDSVVLWVDPLLLISFTEVMGNFIGGLQEVLHNGVVGWVLVQVNFGDVKGLELFSSEVVVSNLWEGE